MIYIIDYNAGNLTSVKRALDNLNINSEITSDSNKILNAEKIIFPGVGAAGSAMENLKKLELEKAIKEAYKKGTPILGICLGTQIILSHSDESNGTNCLGLIKGDNKLFKLKDPTLKVPHMGWNSIDIKKEHFILKDVKEKDEFYFVHSYFPKPADTENIYATCEYEVNFCAATGKNNLFAVQFHPEKSGRTGLSILKNFYEWDGKSC